MILLGDSDISRWPPSQYPSLTPPPSSSMDCNIICNYGVGGAEMKDLLQQFNTWEKDCASKVQKESNASSDVFVCCAGENDIGSGRSIDQILENFRTFLDVIFAPSQLSKPSLRILIFLGPKFEPWLIDDNSSRKQYAKLNTGLQRAIRKHHATNQIYYIDCLTLFCSKETRSIPGALTAKAIPDSQNFDKDGLHLNDTGYGIWKRIVEEKISLHNKEIEREATNKLV